jgi:glycerate kinase
MPARTLLVASRAFGERLDAQRVAAAVARGLRDGGWQADPCPIEPLEATSRPPRQRSEASGGRGSPPADPRLRELLLALDFDGRMRAARALIICERELHEDTLAGSVAFELATRARQAGVPAFAVTAHNGLDRFDARVLDLQAIVEAPGARSLRSAGRKLAGLI